MSEDTRFPLLVQFPNGEKVVISSPYDLPPGAILKVLETQYEKEIPNEKEGL